MTFRDFLGRLEGVRGGGDQYTARCPAHGDQHNSLSVSVGKNGQVLLHCHAGCEPQEIVEAMGLTMKDLFTEITPGEAFPAYSVTKTGKAPIVATYSYRDEAGKLLAQKLRRADKSFLWRKPDGSAGWEWNRKGVPNVLYNLPVLAATGSVWVVEGEKDVDNLTAQNQPAVCGADGAGPGKWIPAYTEALRGKKVIVVQDNDEVGKSFAAETANALHGAAESVKVLDLSTIWPGLPEHGDTSDLMAHMGAQEAVAAMVIKSAALKEWEAKGPSAGLSVISAVDLQEKDIPPIKFIVDGLLPHGLNMLAAPSKYGKSWMVLALCLSVAAGEPFLGHKTSKCGCLYLALEDSQRRLKGRMNKVLAGKKAPEGFYYATSAHDMDNGLFGELESFLKAHPDTGLIVIDTLQKVRGGTQGREGAYANDYREVGTLKSFADQYGIALLLVHHLRKMRDDGDPFNMISGTNGIMGAADTTMVLTKEKRGDENATLSIVGRDVESSDAVVRFNKETCHWENLGDADWLAEQRAKLEYRDSPIVKTIKKLLEQSPEGWDGTAQQILDAGRFIAKTYLAPTARDLSSKIKSLDKPLFDYDGIIHERKSNGSGGGRHRFYYADLQMEELDQAEIDPFSTV